MSPFVHDSFAVPSPLRTERFELEPLAESHNEEDLEAWGSSIGHIHSTPGFIGRSWPPAEPMTPDENLRDLQRHARDYADRNGFTYAVRSHGDYVGCVYFYPARDDDHDVDIRSWVRRERAELDKPLYEALTAWLGTAWPWTRPDYAAR